MKVQQQEIIFGPGVKDIFSKKPLQLTLLGFFLLGLIIVMLSCFLILICFNHTQTVAAVLSSADSSTLHPNGNPALSNELNNQFKGYYQLKKQPDDYIPKVMISGILPLDGNDINLQQCKRYDISFSDPQLLYLNGKAVLIKSYPVKGGIFFLFSMQQKAGGYHKFFYRYPTEVVIVTGQENFIGYILKGGS